MAGQNPKTMKLWTEPTMEEKLAFLSQPGSYPHGAGDMLVKETHMSWVFLVDGFVYKLKKPVAYDHFDHRSLESRRVDCNEEVRINQFLANAIYLGVVPLVLNGDAALQLDGRGRTVDWLVKMKRIPEELMLEYAIRHHNIDEEKLRSAAVLLVMFYQAAERYQITGEQYLQRLQSDIDYHFGQLSLPLYALSTQWLESLHQRLARFLTMNETLFLERAKTRKIIDAHGDLRPEHICLSSPPVIIDRLEFSKRLRTMDTAEELAYLGMECELLGNSSVDAVFLAEYEQQAGDRIPPDLVLFYKAKKAFVRAYLVVRHLDEERYRHDPKWAIKTNRYLSLADFYLHHLFPAVQ